MAVGVSRKAQQWQHPFLLRGMALYFCVLLSNIAKSLSYFIFCLPLWALLLSNTAESLLSGYSRDFSSLLYEVPVSVRAQLQLELTSWVSSSFLPGNIM